MALDPRKRVDIIIGGRRASVPEDQVKNVLRKEKLVKEGLILQANWKAMPAGVAKSVALIDLQNHMEKIIRLNRRIPPCVRFYPE